MSIKKRLKRMMAARRVEAKAVKTPDSDEKALWQRRFAWLVQANLTETTRPSEAGFAAKETLRGEYAEKFPDSQIPSWMN